VDARRRRRGSAGLALALWVALSGGGPARADERDGAGSARRPEAGAQSPEPERILPPRITGEPSVAYPAGASGDAVVVLELVVDVRGRVSEASLIRGEEPFASAAASGARAWLFEAATRGGAPVAARIRYEVRFEDPGAAHLTAREAAAGEVDPGDADAVSGAAEGEEPAAEIVVVGARRSPTTLTRAEARELPGAFGDPFRAIEGLPGVTPIGSGLPYFYVRGAPPGNVGYFLDGVRVPALFHAAVGPSVIHPALIERVELHPGPYPARYGRHAGGVVVAETAPPGEAFGGEASLRLVDAGALVQAPFASQRGHVTLSGRTSYTRPVLSLILPELSLEYRDYQGRVAYRLSEADTVSVFAFGAYDHATQERNDGASRRTLYDVGFHRADVRYDRALPAGGRLRVATTVGKDASTISEGQVSVRSDLVGLRTELSQPLGARAVLLAGADVMHERYDLTTRLLGTGLDSARTVDEFNRRYPSRTDVTSGFWVETPLDAAPGVRLAPGLRCDVFNSGDTTTASVDPRASAELDVSPAVTLVHGVGLAHQRPSFLIPVPGIQPELDRLQRSVQSSYGVRWRLPEDLLASATAYHAIMFGLSDAFGISRLDNGDPAVTEETRMRGRAYGIELMVRRPLTRRLGGFLAYTLSRSERLAGRVSGPAAADRTHVASAALGYDLGRRWRAGARAMVYTGAPADVAYVEAARNPPRTAPYWRLDWRVEKRWPIGSSGAWWAVVFEVLNTTLNSEEITRSCSAYVCRRETFGPVTVPSVGLEAAF
jgi:outer membrane receptor protein involved in Fe transport